MVWRGGYCRPAPLHRFALLADLNAPPPDLTGLAVALGAGLLIGLERERRKGEGPHRQAAGLRTFMVAALGGALAQALSAALAAVVLAGVALLAALSYWRSGSDDPGLTTELALITTALIGMLAVPMPATAAACAAVLAAVLAAKESLHRFATRELSQQELHDALLLAALALVLLPLMPAEPLAWLGHLSPRRLLWLLIVLLLVQGAGHVALRVLGPRSGLAVSGLLGGFVSSTATISALGSLVRGGQVPLRAAWCGAVLSMAATWVQVVLMAFVVAPGAVAVLWQLALVGAVVPVALGVLSWLRVGTLPAQPLPTGALRVREALLVAGMLAGAATLVSLAGRWGQGGLMLGAAVAALADAHAPMAGLASLFAAGRLDEASLQLGVMVAIAANALTRTVAAALAGGARYGLWVGLALALNLLTAVLAWAWGRAG